MNPKIRPVVSQPEPSLVLVTVAPRLVLRVALVDGMTFAGWLLDGEPATDPELAAEA